MKEIYLEATLRMMPKESIDELLKIGKVSKTEEGINYIKVEDED